MKQTLSLAVLLLLGNTEAHHHRHRGDNRVQKRHNDISDKKIDPWVYEKVYDAVNPVPYEKTDNVPKQGSYTPYGNPYWPSKDTAAAQGSSNLPGELKGLDVKKLVQMPQYYDPFYVNEWSSLVQKDKNGKDVNNKNIDPWVYDKVYDSVNPQPLERL